MKKVNITLTFDDDKLDALEFSLPHGRCAQAAL